MSGTRDLVQRQCLVVAHLAEAIRKVHDDLAVFYGDSTPNEAVLEIVGKRTARFMEQLGDMLNEMDAVTDEDEWTHPVFELAQRRWPTEGKSGSESK